MSLTSDDVLARVQHKVDAAGIDVPPDILARIVRFTIQGLAEEFAEGDQKLSTITHMKEVWSEDDWHRVIPDILDKINKS